MNLKNSNRNKLISFIVCSNGYGHIKRVITVVNEINFIDKNIKTIIFINKTHLKFLKASPNFKINEPDRVVFKTTLSEFEPFWDKNLSFKLYQSWNKKLSQNKFINKSNLIISDNYISPLGVLNNVILMGSFLWIDIENRNKDINKIIDYENNLLFKNKPEMLCQKDLVMNSVADKTNAIKLPWFCSKTTNQLNLNKKNSILFTGGGTKNNNNFLVKIIKQIRKEDINLKCFVDKNLYKYFKNENPKKIIQEFDFSEDSFSTIKYIVCRPGVGILTDCIKYEIVPIALDFNDNSEMKFNSNIISKIEIGYSLVISEKINEIAIEILGYINDNKSYLSILKKVKSQLTGGHLEAAKNILSRI